MDHAISFHIYSVESLWFFTHWKHCCLCLSSNSGFLLDTQPFILALICFLFLCTWGSHDVYFLLLFGRDTVSLPSLIDFNTKLIMLKTVWDVQIIFHLLLTYCSCICWWCHSFLLLGIFNCFDKADNPSLSCTKLYFFSLELTGRFFSEYVVVSYLLIVK